MDFKNYRLGFYKNVMGLSFFYLLTGSNGQSGTPIEINETLQSEIVDRFNSIRSSVNPNASNMSQLVSSYNIIFYSLCIMVHYYIHFFL